MYLVSQNKFLPTNFKFQLRKLLLQTLLRNRAKKLTAVRQFTLTSLAMGFNQTVLEKHKILLFDMVENNGEPVIHQHNELKNRSFLFVIKGSALLLFLCSELKSLNNC